MTAGRPAGATHGHTMFDIRTVADTDLLVASRHLAGGASHSPLAGRTVTKQTVYSEIRRRQLSIDPPPGPAIDTDPRGPYRWDLEVDENDGFLCPMPNGETAGRCRAELVVEGIGWEYLGLDCEMARPLTDVHVESWTVRCTNGHVLEIGPNDGNGAPAFRLDRFLTGEGHTVDEDEPVTTDDGHPSATPPDGPKSGVFDCPGVETLVVEKGATCRVCGFATTMVPADLPYPELVKLFDTHTCKEKPV